MPTRRLAVAVATAILGFSGQALADPAESGPPASPSATESRPEENADAAPAPQASSEAAAQDSDSGFHWDVSGQYRLWSESRSGFPVDVDGASMSADTMGYQIAEVGAALGYGSKLQGHLGIRVFSGALFGDPPCVGGGDCELGPGGTAIDRPSPVDSGAFEDMVEPRAAYVEWRSPVGVFRVGHQASYWGLGLLANDGRDGTRTRRLDVFNERQHGDLVERFLFATRPVHAFASPAPGSLGDRLLIGLGGDLVYRDENARLLEGDVAAQGVLIVALRPPDRPKDAWPLPGPDWEIGTYSVFRYQVDDDDDTLGVAAFDVFARIAGALTQHPRPLRGELAVEGAWLYGSTTRVATEEGPDEVGVNALGLAVEASLEIPDPSATVGLRFGFASGDANADDDTSYRFTFDRDFKAGLIVFDHVLAELSARSFDHATDPERSAVPPRGVELFPTDGAVTSALFVNPILIFEPLDELALALGGVWARATAPWIDPFQTFSHGGVPTNPFGRATDQRSLGIELDLMARYRWPIVSWLDVEARAEYGVFMFGAAFADAAGNRPAPVHYASGRVGLYW